MLKSARSDQLISQVSPRSNVSCHIAKVKVSWQLPAHGVARPDCGLVMDAYLSCCVKVLRHYCCHRPECPVCYKFWAAREGKAVEHRMQEAARLYHREGVELGPVKHVIYSPPQEVAELLIASPCGYTTLKGWLRKVVAASGVKGGCAVFHPARTTGGLHEGPHFHVLGFGWIQRTEEIYSATGWVVKNKGGRRSVSATTGYLLSHAGIGRYENGHRLHAVTWFGALGYNAMKKKNVVVEQKFVPCPVCGKNMHLFSKADEDLGEYVIFEKRVTYALKVYLQKKLSGIGKD